MPEPRAEQAAEVRAVAVDIARGLSSLNNDAGLTRARTVYFLAAAANMIEGQPEPFVLPEPWAQPPGDLR
jgi:hypothetical protein